MRVREEVFSQVMERRGAGPDVWNAVTRLEGGWLDVDTSHSAYPKKYQTVAAVERPPGLPPSEDDQQASSTPSVGPGTELKKLLKSFGITATETCPCNARARQMDLWGPDVCEQKLPEIVDWMAEQAADRNLPFVRFAAEQAVKLAIRRARRAAAR